MTSKKYYNAKGMSKETYEHISKFIHLLDIDLKNGIILNRESIALRGGYPCVGLMYKKIQQHQIFAVARWGETCIGMTVNHINECKTDNSWDNLELLSHEDNVRVFSSHGCPKKPIKAINIDTGETIVFDSQREASIKLGLSGSNIFRVLNGKRNRVGRYTFERIETA